VLNKTLLNHHIWYSCIQVWMTQRTILSLYSAAAICASSSVNAQSVQKPCDCTMYSAMVLTFESKVNHCTVWMLHHRVHYLQCCATRIKNISLRTWDVKQESKQISIKLWHCGWQNDTTTRQINKKGNSHMWQHIFMLYEFICTTCRKTKTHQN
jgi:hypothetical protein